MKSIVKTVCRAGLLFAAFTTMRMYHQIPSASAYGMQADSTDALFAAGTQPQLIAKQFSFTEGPSVDKKGNVFFTDQPNDKIWEYSVDSKLSVFMDKAGRANGTYFDKKGNLIACADGNNELWSISPKKEVTVLLKNYEGHLFNGPNDVWVAPNGGLYISDPYFKRDYWTRTTGPELGGERVYYLPKGASKPLIADGNLKKPNGIVGTPDGKNLYVSDGGKIFKYTINNDGSLTDRVLFAPQGSDGMTLDNKGNLYLTGRGVTIYNPQGKRIAQIPINEPWTANICFSGKNNDVLFITASTAIYIFQMKVKGVE